MTWDLYNTQPIELHHPAELMIAVAAVSPVSNGIVWWNAEYISACTTPMGTPGTGFAANPVFGKVEFHAESNTWRVFTDDGTIYFFILPEENLQKQWDAVKDTMPALDVLHQQALELYGRGE